VAIVLAHNANEAFWANYQLGELEEALKK
jgi:hypothetical protein